MASEKIKQTDGVLTIFGCEGKIQNGMYLIRNNGEANFQVMSVPLMKGPLEDLFNHLTDAGPGFNHYTMDPKLLMATHFDTVISPHAANVFPILDSAQDVKDEVHLFASVAFCEDYLKIVVKQDGAFGAVDKQGKFHKGSLEV